MLTVHYTPTLALPHLGGENRWSEMKKLCSTLLILAMMVVGGAANAQKASKVRRIGYLASTRSAFTSAAEDALRRGLRDLGYIDGQNIVIESRSAEGELDRLPGLVAGLVIMYVTGLWVAV